MNPHAELFGRAYQVLQDRQRWETKQRIFYQMRHDGIRRRNKPFPNAADLHLALIDQAISKAKPFWMAQVLGSEHLAAFVSMRQQLAETTESARDFFDFELKQRTNFLRKLETAVDTMLLRGRGVLKCYVDPFEDYKIMFENVDPLFILMRETDNDFEDAEEFVHVRQIAVTKFERDRRYAGDTRKLRGGKDSADRFEAVIDRLRGSLDRDFEMIFTDIQLREGITHTPQDDTIVLWEHYVRTMGGWTVYSYAPMALDIQVRKPYGVPYKVGGRVSLPFFSIVPEVKDEGWYAPRGLADKIAADENFGCKLWNEWADSITFLNRPLLTSETPLQNPANYRWQAGEYMPGNVRAVQFGQPSVSFGEQMNFVRGEAELKTQAPDFGIERPGKASGDKRTATENKRIAALQNTGQNHNGMIFRTDLCKIYSHAWGLMLQYKRKDLTYFITDDLKVLPEQALHDQYFIMPGGGTDDWDKAARLQKAAQRFEMFKGDPLINQDELHRDVLSADDARLVKRLLIPQNMKAANETEDEAQEITSMIVTHYPAPVMPGEDHLSRVKILIQFLMAQGQKGRAVDPLARQRLQEHLGVHLKYLKETDPAAFKQVVMMLKKLESMPMPTAGTGTQPLAGAGAANNRNGAVSPPSVTAPAANPSGGLVMV